jgi:hypothetical protein
VESDVAHDHTIHDHLVDPPDGRLVDRAQHRPMAGEQHRDGIDAVGERILRMPGWPLFDRCGAQPLGVPHPCQHQAGHLNWQRHDP